MKYLMIFCIAIFFFACKEQPSIRKNNIDVSALDNVALQDSLQLVEGKMKEVFNADSAVVLYYKTPGNPRFFSYTKVTNMLLLKGLMRNVNESISDSTKGCVTNGKIYFYDNTEAVYTVYFSNSDSCSTLSYIKTGEKFFTKMNAPVKELIDSLYKHAVK